MAKRFFQILVMAAAVSFALPAGNTEAFPAPATGTAGKCSDCHVLSKDEAAKILKTDMFKAQVREIRMSPVKGLWEIEVSQGDKVFIVYLDFAKKHLVEGRYTPVDQLGQSAPLKKVDLKKIPLDGAIVLGNAKAEKKIIVFDDPECPYCAKLHEEIIRGKASEALSRLSPEPKGEVTLILRTNEETAAFDFHGRLEELITSGAKLNDAVKAVAADSGHPRSEVYKEALAIKERLKEKEHE